jgi:hypothetical protein
MKLTRLPNLLPGERPLALAPELAPAVDARWQRRANLYAGRTLTAPTLRLEQTHRAARLTLSGQAVSAGIVEGLECAVETETLAGEEVPSERFLLRLEPGLGLADSGEQVALDAAVRIDLLDIPVCTTPEIIARAEGGEPAPPVEATGGLAARRVGPPLRALRSPAAGLPRAGVLVLQPAIVEAIGEFDPDDPCERDAVSEAFEDQLEIDALRLIYYAWPTEWRALPVADAQWRNRLAHAVFETQRAQGAALPWEAVGVPIALIAFDADWQPLFLDRAAVVRAGGRPRAGASAFPARGDAFLWQARIEQLSEHMSEFMAQQAQRVKPADVDDAIWRARLLDELAQQFRHLPPAGLLPREVAEPRSRSQSFFPARFAVDAVPVPLEQLDLAIESAAALDGYDTFAADAVRMLVPVPQQWYEPRLLQTEEVPAEFAAKVGALVGVRGQWLQRRADVRAKSSVLAQALTGKPLEFPRPDPDAFETEELPNSLPEPAEDAYGTETAGDEIRVAEFEALKDRLRAGSPINGTTRETLATAPAFPDGLGAALRAKIAHDPANRRLSFSGVMSAAERDSLLALSADAEYRSAVGRLHARSQDDELAQLEARGLEGFIALLEQKIARADDLVDLGFLRVQTDLYRTRQLVLGSKAASRLAVSPALAGFAKSQSAVATQQQLEKFYEGLRGRPITPPPAGGVAGGPAAPRAPAGPATPRAGFGAAMLAAGGQSLLSEGLRPDAGIERRADIAEGVALAGGAAARETVAKESSPGLFAAARQAFVLEQLVGQQAVVGKALLRSSTIAERMESPQAPEAKNSAVATKHEVVRMLAGLPISTDGLTAVGVSTTPDQAADRALPGRGAAMHLGDFARPELLGQLLAEPDPKTQDESLFFAAGVELADQSIAALRGVEGRIAQYRAALDLCKAALAKIRASAAAAGLRLTAIGRELAEARHDVGVARALLAEESARVARINARRDEILREHVRFLAYCRPRSADTLLAAPTRPLAPGLTASPVPACLRDHGDGPHELRALLEVLREAPLTWFSQLRGHLVRLDRLDVLMETARNARLRAARHVGVALEEFPERGGPLGSAVKTVVAAQQRTIAERRSAFAGLDVASFTAASWQTAQTQLAAHLSIADLLDNPSRRSDLAREIAEEVERIGKVTACLHARFAEVPPFLRLLWVEQFSQYDGPVNLRNLAALPRFHELDVLDRRDLQQLVDWLFGRVDPTQAQAVGLIGDLVRLAILLASHAPVNELVAGRVRVPGRVRPGQRIELAAFEPARVRIGMQVLLYDQDRVSARAIVEDLSATQVAARVIQADADGSELKPETRVQFTRAQSFGARARG